MADSLEVHLNRNGPHSIDVGEASYDAEGFEVDESFDVVLRNHGAALHVYLQLDEDLSDTAELGAANHFVEEEQIRRVRVIVSNDGRPVTGRLKIVTGYGSETEYVTISVVDPATTEDRVLVDETLSQPLNPPTEPVLQPKHLPVVALGILALIVALIAGFMVGGPRVFLGLIVVFVGLGIAGTLLLR